MKRPDDPGPLRVFGVASLVLVFAVAVFAVVLVALGVLSHVVVRLLVYGWQLAGVVS